MAGATDPGLEARTIDGVRRSTRFLLSSFKEKTEELKPSGPDIATLLRFGTDQAAAAATGREFFGGPQTEYVAVDGTRAVDPELDMLVFYVGAFGYSGTLRFEQGGVEVGNPSPVDQSYAVSASIPLAEDDAAAVFGEKTESGTELDMERLPDSLMHLAEYYIAARALESPRVGVVILDRSLAGDVSHLVWRTRELVRAHASVLEGMGTPQGPVTNLDLELARMLVPNPGLKLPVPRSQYLKYAALHHMFTSGSGAGAPTTVDRLLKELEADPTRAPRLEEELDELDREHHILERSGRGLALKPGVGGYWERVLGASLSVAGHVFNPTSDHPLRIRAGAGDERWITADDMDYLVLVLVQMLTRESWSRPLLPLGLVKDTGASELVRTVAPLMGASGLLKMGRALPSFNSDKMLLQTNSVVNARTVPTPWHTVDIDATFRTMVPVPDDALPEGEARVRGAHRNVVYPERVYVKTYMQLWSSKKDPAVRSHVFTFDRPAFAGYDRWDALSLHNRDDGVDEKISPILNLGESPMTNLAMSVLFRMAQEVIPEALGHNYPLFLADKKAKFVLRQNREAYLGAVAVEMARSDLDQQVLFSQRFRDYRSEVESTRRASA